MPAAYIRVAHDVLARALKMPSGMKITAIITEPESQNALLMVEHEKLPDGGAKLEVMTVTMLTRNGKVQWKIGDTLLPPS